MRLNPCHDYSPRPFTTAKSNGSRCASGRSTPIHSAVSQNSMFSILLSTVMARRPSKNPISTKSHTTAQSLTFIELSLSAIRDTPLGRGPMSPPHSGPRPEFFGLHTLLRRLSGARSLPRLDLGLRLRGWCGDWYGHPVSPSTASETPTHPRDPPEAVRSPRFACRDTRPAPAQ